MVVFGIDPGYAIVGWGAINFQSNTYKTLGYGAIETVAGTDFNKRLEYIYDETYAILNRCRPDALGEWFISLRRSFANCKAWLVSFSL